MVHQSEEGAYGGQGISEFLAQVCLTVAPVGPQTHLVFLTPVPVCIIGIDKLSSGQNPYIDFLTYRMRDIMVEKAKRKLLVLPLPRKIMNQK